MDFDRGPGQQSWVVTGGRLRLPPLAPKASAHALRAEQMLRRTPLPPALAGVGRLPAPSHVDAGGGPSTTEQRFAFLTNPVGREGIPASFLSNAEGVAPHLFTSHRSTDDKAAKRPSAGSPAEGGRASASAPRAAREQMLLARTGGTQSPPSHNPGLLPRSPVTTPGLLPRSPVNTTHRLTDADVAERRRSAGSPAGAGARSARGRPRWWRRRV